MASWIHHKIYSNPAAISITLLLLNSFVRYRIYAYYLQLTEITILVYFTRYRSEEQNRATLSNDAATDVCRSTN